MNNMNVVELSYSEIIDIAGGKSVAYYVGYAAGTVYEFCKGFWDEL